MLYVRWDVVNRQSLGWQDIVRVRNESENINRTFHRLQSVHPVK